jgi:hypothetical protein
VTVKLSASIMAHVDRSREATELWADLVYGVDRNVSISWDMIQPASGDADRVWGTARVGWSLGLATEGGTHHVLIQDDALVCADFLAGLEQALAFVPENAIVSPYLGKAINVPTRWETVANRATAAGARWIRSDTVMWGVCLVMPTALIPEMVAWADKRSGRPDDMRVGGFAKANGLEVWYPWPSLVDHRADMASLTKHRARDRVARRFHTGSALELDWSGPVVTDPVLARRTAGRSGPSQRVEDSRLSRHGTQ